MLQIIALVPEAQGFNRWNTQTKPKSCQHPDKSTNTEMEKLMVDKQFKKASFNGKT